MRWMSLMFALVVACSLPCAAQPTLIVVQGAAGEEAYGKQFAQWRARWEAAGKQGGATVVVIGDKEEAQDDAEGNAERSDKSRLGAAIDVLKENQKDAVWIVLLGHGTFDGKTARFNLRGPDVSADELAQWLTPVECPVAIINCSSSSGPFLTALKGRNRIVITATRSGSEMNFARFGDHLSQAIADKKADLDKDGQTSLLEAYLLATRQTQEWYKEEGRLATEHALLDDSGDGLGTPADWFRGVHAIKKAKEDGPVDGVRAAQWWLVPGEREKVMSAEKKQQRDELELKIAALRQRKMTMSEDAYYSALESLLVDLAKLYSGSD